MTAVVNGSIFTDSYIDLLYTLTHLYICSLIYPFFNSLLTVILIPQQQLLQYKKKTQDLEENVRTKEIEISRVVSKVERNNPSVITPNPPLYLYINIPCFIYPIFPFSYFSCINITVPLKLICIRYVTQIHNSSRKM